MSPTKSISSLFIVFLCLVLVLLTGHVSAKVKKKGPSAKKAVTFDEAMSTVQQRWSAEEVLKKPEGLDDTIEALYTWISNHGGHLNGVEIAWLGGRWGRGVRSLQPIKAGRKIATIPLPLIMTPDVGFSSPIGDLLEELNLGHTSTMALFVMSEYRRDNSPYRPYLDSLPSWGDLHTTMQFTPDDIVELQRSAIADYVFKRQSTAEKNCKEIYSKIAASDFKLYFADSESQFCHQFKWALSVMWSRTFSVYYPEFNSTSAGMVPFGDMINTAPKLDINVESRTEGDSFVFYTIKDIDAGQQLFAPYSTQLTNGRALMDYGFVGTADFDEAWLDIEPWETSLAPIARKLLSELELGDTGLGFRIGGPNKMSEKMVYAARIVVATPSELKRYQNVKQWMRDPISLDNEKAAHDYLVKAAERELNSYGSTLSKDLSILARNPPRSPKKLNAVLLRIGEKRVLEMFIAAGRDHIKKM